MSNDPITEAIRNIRHDLAAQFDNDISEILADVRRREALDGRTYVTLPRRQARTQLAEQIDARETSAQSVLNSKSSPRSP